MLESETANERPRNRQRLRVPREDGALFAEPSLREAADLARQNRSCFQCSAANIQGRTLDSLRHWSREQVAGAARSYTSKLLDESIPEQPFDYLLAAGHQPTLFHAGVWVKNFAIGELASQTGGLAVNLVVDNDTLTAAHIRVPDGNRNRPRVRTVAFDREHASEPWEESQILDRGLFESFSQRLNDQMASWNIAPLINTAWPYAVRHMERSMSLRDCLTTARVQLERKWGLSNLELPISQLCELDSFLWFAAHVFAQLPRFREIHNQVLHEYRVINKIRSRTHPVPELKFESGWHEAPFWIWRSGDAHRGRVYARQHDNSIQLSDGNDVFATLPLTVDADATDAVDVLRRLPEQGFRLRTRALTTTLFARLCVSDLFVHGIGGAKYDEINDRIISRFFNLPVPGFLTMSATLHLPLADPFDVRPSDETHLRVLLRELEYNSDRYLTTGVDPQVDALIAEKKHMIAHQQRDSSDVGLNRRERRLRSRDNHDRYLRFREINRVLAEQTNQQRSRTGQELDDNRAGLDANSVLQDREFSFALFPEEKLRPFMTSL